MQEIKTDHDSVFGLCNSLNAEQGFFRADENPHLRRVAQLLLDAQMLISKLYRENQDLKGNKEDHE